ncbi:MAG: T9SS type A sorting domain-containing protein [Chitinophagaceae bacterium]|nr:T9SS type A sorting domain-containing protein [Chitinophagaceae bacterium]
MKKTFLLLSICFWNLSTIAQTLEISFDSSSEYITIDSAANNTWQVGSPDKCFFGNYSNTEKAMITDTVNYYPSNNYSSFTLSIPFFLGEWYGICMLASYSLDSDTLKDGGYVEYAFDNDTNWTILSNSVGGISNFNDTITGGTPAITGQRKLWDLSDCTCFLRSGHPKYRFVFKSDSIDNQRCGWSIYHITINVIYCDGIGEIKTNEHFSSVFPNPISSNSSLQIQNQNGVISKVDFYDALGRNISTLYHPHQSNISINKEKFGEGIFYYRVELSNHKTDNGTFVVQ